MDKDQIEKLYELVGKGHSIQFTEIDQYDYGLSSIFINIIELKATLRIQPGELSNRQLTYFKALLLDLPLDEIADELNWDEIK